MTFAEFLNILILGITAWIVWRYTQASQKSNEIQERPILNLYLRKQEVGTNKMFKLRLRNVGKGPAYNIRFEKIIADGYTYTPYFEDENPILEGGGDEKTVTFWVNRDNAMEVYDAHSFQLLLSRAFPRKSNPEDHEKIKRSALIFIISYEGVNGNEYYSLFRLYSKIWPLLDVYRLIVEFIKNGSGSISKMEATQLCESKETQKWLSRE